MCPSGVGVHAYRTETKEIPGRRCLIDGGGEPGAVSAYLNHETRLEKRETLCQSDRVCP